MDALTAVIPIVPPEGEECKRGGCNMSDIDRKRTRDICFRGNQK